MNKGEKRERKRKSRKRLLTMENKQLPEERWVGRWDKQVKGIEYTYFDEHWEMHRIVASLYCAPETNMTLYGNYTGIKFFKKCLIS